MAVYHGRTVRVLALDRVLVALDLGMHVALDRVFSIAGIDQDRVPPALRTEALHCLVVLLGGKRILVSVQDDDDPIAHVYLNERVRAGASGLFPVSFDSTPRLDVGLFFMSLLDDFSVARVKAVLNG